MRVLSSLQGESANLLANVNQALARDPDFSLAYAGPSPDELTIAIRDQLAQENARRALTLDPSSGLAYAALGVAHRFARRDPEAEGALERALEFHPSDPRVLRDVAFFHIYRGRYERALDFARRIVGIDPGLGNFLISNALWCLRDLEEAQAALDKVLALRPNFNIAHMFAGHIAALRGDQAAALKSYQLAETFGIAELGPGMLSQIALGYQLAGHAENARRVFQQFKGSADECIVSEATWVLAYLAVEDTDNALLSLRGAVDRGGAGEDIFEAFVAFNVFDLQVLEKPEFAKARKKLGVAANAR